MLSEKKILNETKNHNTPPPPFPPLPLQVKWSVPKVTNPWRKISLVLILIIYGLHIYLINHASGEVITTGRNILSGTNTIVVHNYWIFCIARVTTKYGIRIHISTKNRQHTGQKKKNIWTDNDLQNIHTKLKIEYHESLKTWRERRRSLRINSSFPTSGTRRVTLATILVTVQWIQYNQQA